MTHTRIDLSRYVDIPIWYNCNNDCIICMLSGLKQKLSAVGVEVFEKIISHIVEDRAHRNLILSGAEITTFGLLEKYVRYAASFGWFEKIQIQTNGRKLCDPGYARTLIDAGVNQYFISVHGLEAVHDAVTRTPGSFSQTLQGIRNLENSGAHVITNTVLTKINMKGLYDVISFLCDQPVSELQLWNFCPMETTDSRDLLVRMKDLVKGLAQIRDRVAQSGKTLTLKHFPLCLEVSAPVFLDNRVPLLLIHGLFWEKFAENRFGICIHREKCQAVDCPGLSLAYVKKFGDERTLLSPVRFLKTQS